MINGNIDRDMCCAAECQMLSINKMYIHLDCVHLDSF